MPEVISTFDTGLDGWTIEGDVADFEWEPTGGNPGGHLYWVDAVTGAVSYYDASAAFLGDKSAFYGGSLSYDIEDTGSDYSGVPDIELVGNGLTLDYTAGQAGTTWTHYSAPLTEVGWTVQGSGAAATAQQMQQVLGDLTTILIRAEFVDGYETGGLDNVDMVACFCPGTMILTTRGEVAVEALRVGDLAVTFLGAGAVLKPVRWLGHTSVDLRRHPRPKEARPVRIRAEALAQGRPSRDLLVSPGHRFPLDGVLVAASDLVNGASIVQEAPDQVEYWHVELDRHDILLADGVEAESYQDTGNRHVFEATNVVALHPSPDLELDGYGPEPCLPHAEADTRLRRRLIARAKHLGWQLVRDPAPFLEVAGRRIEPVRDGNRYRFELPEAATQARLCSRANRPSDSDAGSTDHRRLGLSVHRLGLTTGGAAIAVALDDARLDAGFSYVERDAEVCWRWTDGAALLPLADLAGGPVSTVEITIKQDLRFWVEPGTMETLHAAQERRAVAG